MTYKSPEPEAHVLCVQAFRVELEFKSPGFFISPFPMFYSRIHGNLGLNKLVSLRHLLLSFLSDFILSKGKMKPSSYGLVEKFA